MGNSKKRGFVTNELLVVTSIITILIAIILPVVARVRLNVQRSSCQSNLKQVSLSMMHYAQDYDKKLPFAFQYYDSTDQMWWQDTIQPYTKNYELFVCRSDGSPASYSANRIFAAKRGHPATLVTSYAVNETALPGRPIKNSSTGNPLASFVQPAATILALDASDMQISIGYSDTTSATQPSRIDKRHLEGANFLFADGHVKWLKQTQASQWTRAAD